ncbi:MAG: hypothetical protein GY838_17885 [bacterium]|nr:hypothetical protein [bacterium]
MKSFVMAALLLMVASVAFGQVTPIFDIQNGAYTEGSLLTPRGVVTGATGNGFFMAEAPYTEYCGIWVYSPDHTMVPGDEVQICGVYEEYYGLTEINVPAADIYGSVLKVGDLPVPMPSVVSAADIFVDPLLAEPWESCLIIIQDGMIVSALPSSYGEWFADALDGTPVMFDDYWYDDTQVAVGQCYNNATGILNYGFGNFKLEALVDGIPIVNCAVPTDEVSFGALKALYR